MRPSSLPPNLEINSVPVSVLYREQVLKDRKLSHGYMYVAGLSRYIRASRGKSNIITDHVYVGP